MNRIQQLVETFKEVCETKAIEFGEAKLIEIATNCISLSETWFENYKPNMDASFALEMFGADGTPVNTIYGVTRDNLPNSLMSVIAENGINHYSKVSLISYRYGEKDIDGSQRKIVDILGELEIS